MADRRALVHDLPKSVRRHPPGMALDLVEHPVRDRLRAEENGNADEPVRADGADFDRAVFLLLGDERQDPFAWKIDVANGRIRFDQDLLEIQPDCREMREDGVVVLQWERTQQSVLLCSMRSGDAVLLERPAGGFVVLPAARRSELPGGLEIVRLLSVGVLESVHASTPA